MTQHPSPQARLRDTIDDHFDLEELRDLCLDMGIEFDNLGGEGKRAKVRELVALVVRKKRVDDLRQRILKLRDFLTPDDLPRPEVLKAENDHRLRHLPPLDAHFVNRRHDLDALLRDVQPGAVVTLCGPGGIGKSALATRAVRQLDADRFPDGIFFHTFYGQPDTMLAFESLALAFGVEPIPTPALAAQQALHGKRALLFLDGAEEAEDLPALLNVRGDCGVLITSRRKHDALHIRQDVTPLDAEHAEDLLQAWGKLPSDDPHIAPLCQLTGGLPLAIRLIGHYLDESGETPAEYLDWLKTQPFEALDHGTHRLESVKALLDRSVAHVSDDARQMLSVIGLLAFAPFTVEPLAAALNAKVRPCRTALGQLVDYGLLLRDGAAYTISHALVHTYLRQEMPASPDTLDQLAAYYTEFATTQCSQGLEGYARLDSERPHILHLLECCQDQQHWPPVSPLVWAVGKYLDLRGYWSAYQTALDINLLAAQQQEDRKDEGWCMGALGYLAQNQGDYATALTYLEQSLSLRQEIGDKAGEGTTLNNISQIYKARGDYATALTYLEQSLSLHQEIGDKAGEGTTLNNISQIYDARGDYATALTYLEQSLSLRQEIGDKAGEGTTLNNISQIYDARGDYATALTYLEQSLSLRQEIGDKAGEGVTLSNISQIYRARGDDTTALTYLEQSLSLHQEIGDKAGMCFTMFNMGRIHLRNEERPQAMTAWVTVYRLAKPMNLAQVLEALERLAIELEHPEGLEFWEQLSTQLPLQG